jgi:hypothetical protein
MDSHYLLDYKKLSGVLLAGNKPKTLTAREEFGSL